jgi:hypothetical protein
VGRSGTYKRNAQAEEKNEKEKKKEITIAKSRD